MIFSENDRISSIFPHQRPFFNIHLLIISAMNCNELHHDDILIEKIESLLKNVSHAQPAFNSLIGSCSIDWNKMDCIKCDQLNSCWRDSLLNDRGRVTHTRTSHITVMS